MNVCPQCHTPNRPEARFCRQCRSALPTVAALPCTYCGASLRPGARYCKQCGRPVAAAPVTGARLSCPHCGVPVRATARFCPRCCTPLALPPGSAAGPHCPICGTPTRPGARFCRTCSHPQVAPIPSPGHPLWPPPGRCGTGDLLPLTRLAGRYAIMEKIAQGGMGAIYKAQDTRLQGKIVAVKEMSESAIKPPDRERILESFQREAELLAQLKHPNLVRVTDYFLEGERRYMVMEFIAGQTLEKMLEGRSEPFPEEQVLIWAGQLCDVLSFLHSQEPKIIYRDVKPANVMVVEGADIVKLIDFGIARFFKPGKRKDTIELGTDGYAPPEQYGKSQTDERADVYALGAMLHRLLTLRDPLTCLFDFPPVCSLNPQVNRGVEAAIARAVENNKDKRHQSIEEMGVALLGKEMPARGTPTRPVAIPPAGSGVPILVDFGKVWIGTDVPAQSLDVAVPAGETATLSADVPWLRVHPASISADSSRVTVAVDTHRLKPGRLSLTGTWLKKWAGWHTRFLVPVAQEQRADVAIQVKGGQRQCISARVTAAPQPWQFYAGWLGTVLAMLVEAGAVLALLGAIAIGLF